MKQMMFALISFFWFLELHGQELTRTQVDTILLRAIERSIDLNYTGNDSTGIVYIKVIKKGDSLKIETLYSSLIYYTLNIESALNSTFGSRYINFIPNNYSGIVPLYFCFETISGDFHFPTKEQELTAENIVKSKCDSSGIFPPIRYIKFQSIRRSAYNK